MLKIQRDVDKVFRSVFGRTPLKERLKDIFGEAVELSRYTDFDSIREELGDLLASGIMLSNELGLDFEEVVGAALAKIKRRRKQYESLARKTYVAILGGAFDPPTLGHIDVAKYVLDTSSAFDEVWLMPCGKHMNNKKMADAKHRLAMCEIAVQADRRIRVFDYEIRQKLSGETFHTMKRLLEDKQYKDTHNFSMIIGMDRAMDFHTWVNFDLLERLVRFVVVPRPGYDWKGKPDWFLKPPHIFLGNADREIREASSTLARTYLSKMTINPERTRHILDPQVFEYALARHLYERQPFDWFLSDVAGKKKAVRHAK